MQVDLLKTTYKPSENEEYMCDNHRQYFKEKLLLWRRELLEKSEIFFEDLKDNNVRPADTLDQSAQQTEIFVDFITRERLGQLLQEIELALDRIEADEYGYCEITDEEIGLKRLEAHPVATRCVESQEQFERLINARRRSVSV